MTDGHLRWIGLGLAGAGIVLGLVALTGRLSPGPAIVCVLLAAAPRTSRRGGPPPQ